MLPDPPSRHRRCFQCTVGRMMVALPIIALAIIFAVGIDPFRPDWHQMAIDRATESCEKKTFTFDATYRYDWSFPQRMKILERSRLVDGVCLLKIAMPDRVYIRGREVETYGVHGALSRDGRLQTWRMTLWNASRGGRTQTTEQMVAIRKILATLPHSQSKISAGPIEEGPWRIETYPNRERRFASRALVLGFPRRGFWVTRVYDRQHLPPEVATLLGDLGIEAN